MFLSQQDFAILKSQLQNNVKNECDHNFLLCHIYPTAQTQYKDLQEQKRKLVNVNEKDYGMGNWLVISLPNDLLRHGIDVNFAKLDYKPLLINNEKLRA